MDNIARSTVADVIVDDIYKMRRSFLPGEGCSAEDVRANLALPILVDGLSLEESALMLSTLPRNSKGIYLSPLDKGLSGSKVVAARYVLGDTGDAKSYVFKIGPLRKIERENTAVEQLVWPHIHGVTQPVFRRGVEKGLIAQELVGLGARSNLKSFREYARDSDNNDKIVRRLFEQRMANWYLHERRGSPEVLSLDILFKPYLVKAPVGSFYPDRWSDLQVWVEETTGIGWGDVPSKIDEIKKQSIRSIITVVHGDLHSQNILIDENDECWPIDFAWCRENASPVVDFVMLECSLKFLAIPWRSDLRTLLKIEHLLCNEPLPTFNIGELPYYNEIIRILRAIKEIRSFAVETIGLTFSDYQKSLFIMTYCLATHLGLNRPYVLGSLQILSGFGEKP